MSHREQAGFDTLGKKKMDLAMVKVAYYIERDGFGHCANSTCFDHSLILISKQTQF